MVDLDAALGEQLFDVAVGEAKAEVPADRQHDHIRREAETGEGRPCNGIGADPAVLMTPVWLLGSAPQQMQQRRLGSMAPPPLRGGVVPFRPACRLSLIGRAIPRKQPVAIA